MSAQMRGQQVSVPHWRYILSVAVAADSPFVGSRTTPARALGICDQAELKPHHPSTLIWESRSPQSPHSLSGIVW